MYSLQRDSKDFKIAFYTLFSKLTSPEHSVIVGSQSFRWKPWYNKVSGFHLVKARRFSMYTSAIIFPHRNNFLIWRTALHFLYNFSFKRYPRVVFVGNNKIIPINELMNYSAISKINEPVVALDYWIPGYISNYGGVPLALNRRLSYRLFLKGNKKIKNFKLSQVPDISTFQSFYYPDLLILLNSSFSAYNADIEVYRRSLPAIFLGDTDSKSYGFSGAFFSLSATTNSIQHLIYYTQLFILVFLFGKQQFFFKERMYFDHFADKIMGMEDASPALWKYHSVNKSIALKETYVWELKHRSQKVMQLTDKSLDKMFYRFKVWKNYSFWKGKRPPNYNASGDEASPLSGTYLPRKELELFYEPYFSKFRNLLLSFQRFGKSIFNLFTIMALQSVYFRSGNYFKNQSPSSKLSLFRVNPLGHIVYKFFKIVKLRIFPRPHIPFLNTNDSIAIVDRNYSNYINNFVNLYYKKTLIQPVKKDFHKLLRIARPLKKALITINKHKRQGWLGFGIFPNRSYFDKLLLVETKRFIRKRHSSVNVPHRKLINAGRTSIDTLYKLFPNLYCWKRRRRNYFKFYKKNKKYYQPKYLGKHKLR